MLSNKVFVFNLYVDRSKNLVISILFIYIYRLILN